MTTPSCASWLISVGKEGKSPKIIRGGAWQPVYLWVNLSMDKLTHKYTGSREFCETESRMHLAETFENKHGKRDKALRRGFAGVKKLAF